LLSKDNTHFVNASGRLLFATCFLLSHLKVQ